MSNRQMLEYVTFLQAFLSLAVLATMFYRKVARIFAALTGYLAISACYCAVALPLIFFRDRLHIPEDPAYSVYFYTYFVVQAVSLSLIMLIIYGIFSEAMRPFPGLQRIGRIIFRWVGVVSLAVALALTTGPQVFSKSLSALAAYQTIVAQLQQGINVLLLCLLIFVCFSIRPLGLTFRSHLFGVVLGLGLLSVVQLVQAAWLVTSGGQSMYSPMQIFGVIGADIAFLVWGVYFALPEPERKMILLPTTSPFFLWNRISEILGDAPGHVAVAGFTPKMLAAAEIEMLTAATSYEAATARERETLESEEIAVAEKGIVEMPPPTRPAHSVFALSQ